MSESTHRSVFRNVLSLSKRIQVIKEYYLNFPKPKMETLANKFNVDSSQIRNILFNQYTILKSYEEASRIIRKSKSKFPENPKTVKDDNGLGVLSFTDRINVVNDYSYRNPKPTISSLATKYGVSSRLISNILLSQDSIVESQKKASGQGICTEEESMDIHHQRQDQIKFLGMVMYEYLQRALYHNVPLDDLQFQKKAAEVKECIAITKFRPTYLWLKGFKKKYGIDDLSLESLRTEIIFTDAKENSLNAADMVRFVREHKTSLLRSESELINQLPNLKQAKTVAASGHVAVGPRNRTEYTLQLGKNNEPEFVYKRCKILKPSTDTITQADSSAIAENGSKIKPEIPPAQLGEKSRSVLKNLKQHFKKPDLSGITVVARKPEVGKVINGRDLLQNIRRNVSSPLLREEDEFLTIFQIVDDEAPTSTVVYNNQCASFPQAYIDNNSPTPDSSASTPDNIIIKTEPKLFDDNTYEQMETSDHQSYNHSQQICLRANNCEGMVIRTETSPIELNEDIKPIIIFQNSEEFIMENDNSHPPRIAIGKRSRSNSPPLPDGLNEDIKPTIIYANGEEFLMETTNSPNGQQHLTMLSIDKRLPADSTPLPEVFDEDIKPTIIFEKSQEFITANNNAASDHNHLSAGLAPAKLLRLDSPLPDIDSSEEAMKLLKILENYALLSDNYRAIGLLTHLEEAFKESPMR